MGNSYFGLTLNSIINGFWITRTGSYRLTIEYSPQKSFQEGILLSSVSFPMGMLLYALTRYSMLQNMSRKLRFGKKRIEKS